MIGVPIKKVNKLGCGSPHIPNACLINSIISMNYHYMKRTKSNTFSTSRCDSPFH